MLVIAAAAPTGTVPTTAATVPACRTHALRIRQLFTQGTTGNTIHVFVLRNTSKGTCHTFGYFGTQLLDERDRNLETRAHRVTHDFFGKQPKRRVTIKAGHSASFRITTITGAGYHCVDARRIGLIAPDDTEATIVKAPIDACQHGTIRVAPVQPGHRARP